MSVLISAAKRMRPTIAEDAAELVRWAVARDSTRQVLAAVYRRLSYATKAQLHGRFSRIFRDAQVRVEPGVWVVSFLGRNLQIPIRSDRAWLDWDAALSLLGHETELKSTYESILQVDARPELFVDVGANYGGHSLLFASQGVECMAFEPNEVCHAYLKELAALNGVHIELLKAALGETEGTVELCFPPTEAWLGTVNNEVRERLESTMPVTVKSVPVLTLDGALSDKLARRMLFKIDVEGAELAVLKGARRVLEQSRPLVLVECFVGGRDRGELFDYLVGLAYGLARLPWDGVSTPRCLSRAEFIADSESNYLAAPRDR